ncbi:MAG: response regulator [candidate division Zixibacteria bacterium]|nr:response regulator [candidate division Zixibacteria bacterium]
MNAIKVMLVDDESQFVDTMSKRLSRRELEVVPAYGGAEAIKILESDEKIDIIILDVKMPGMDGIKTLREIKKIRPLVEVIMLTGHATVESAIEGMKLGAYDYLLKPCDLEALLAAVAEASAKKAKHEEKILEARLKAITMSQGA